MPDVNDMIAQNPEMALAVAPSPPPASDLRGQSPSFDPQPSSWAQLRGHRLANAVMSDPVQQAMAAHHAALADTAASEHVARQLFDYHTATQIQHDTAGFLHEAHGIQPGPDYAQNMLALSEKYPMARGLSEHLQPLHDGQRMWEASHSELEQYKQSQDTEKELFGEAAKGNLTQAELHDPQASVSALRERAALRASGQLPGGLRQMTLSPQESEEWKSATTGADAKTYAKDVLGGSDDDPTIVARKALYYSAKQKILNPTQQPARAASSSTGAAAPSYVPVN
jgi:hypothetical protein